jgi:hypothetical protein
MNKLFATLITGMFAVVSTTAVAQTAAPSAAEKAKETSPAATKADKAKAFAEKEKALQDISRQSTDPAQAKANVDKSKMDAKVRTKYDEKAAQALSRDSTDPAQAKANVDASKAASPKRSRVPNIKDLTPAERAQLRKELEAASKP